MCNLKVKPVLLMVVALLMVVGVVGCGSEASSGGEDETTAVSEIPAESETTEDDEEDEEMSEEDEEEESTADPEFVDFDLANFSHSTNIDNEWLPMQPGTQWVFEGITVEDGEELAHRIEFTITDLVKQIEGVDTVVAYIVDISDGEAIEKEIAFYAQDDDGNVWYFGEHPEEYEDGEFLEAPTWIAGFEEALPGVKMRAKPEVGTGSYFQGWAPAVEWTDFGQVDMVGEETCVAADCYQNVLVIAESSLEEEGAFQLKYYAPGVGNVRVSYRGDDETQEELELVEFAQLDGDALAAIVTEALALEAHAYEVSPDVYGETAPAE